MSHIERVWVFDLDDTLYDASAYVFPNIHLAMTDYMTQNLAVSEAEANQLRIKYWKQYGATLTGLLRHHYVNPHHFLRHTHVISELRPGVRPSPGLRHVLKKLIGKKIIYTNAPMHFAQHALSALGIRHLFQGVFSLETSGFHPKPAHRSFRRFLRRFKLHPARCIMIEDNLAALKTAKRLRMKTVHIAKGLSGSAGYVDVRLRSVLRLNARSLSVKG